MIAPLVAAFLTGLVGGLHCIGMCGGFAATSSARHGGRGTVLYTLGRLSTYMTLGAVGGAVGFGVAKLGYVGIAVSGAMLLYFAGRLAGWIPEAHVKVPWLHGLIRKSGLQGGVFGQYLFGATTALIPCGLVYAALALPIVSASPLTGALAMLAFGVGTVPALAAFGFGAFQFSSWNIHARRLLAVGVLVAGSWAIVDRMPDPEAQTTEEAVPDCCANEHAQ